MVNVEFAHFKLSKWFMVNGMNLNQDKTQLVKLCTPWSKGNG